MNNFICFVGEPFLKLRWEGIPKGNLGMLTPFKGPLLEQGVDKENGPKKVRLKKQSPSGDKKSNVHW